MTEDDTITGFAVVLDTPESIHAFRVLALRKALQLETRTGMRVSSKANTITAAKRLGFTGRTRRAALMWVNQYIEDNNILPAKPSVANMEAELKRKAEAREKRRAEAKLSALGYGPPEDYEDEHVDEMEEQE